MFPNKRKLSDKGFVKSSNILIGRRIGVGWIYLLKYPIPFLLSFRLFGNVLADELTISVLVLLVPLIVPLPIMGLGIFAGSVQALIFSTLAAAYICEALE